MRKIFQYILMAVALLATASCSNELDEALQPVNKGSLQFVVGDFPAFGEGTQTRAIGTQDEGKTAWEDNDKIIVHLYSQEYGNQAVELTFRNGDWNSDGGTLSYLKDENPTITAVYAPDCEIKSDKTIGLIDGRQYGEAEYIQAETTISENTLGIHFESGRTYSRLRIAATANEEVTVTTTGFTPAGATEVATEQYILTADDKGNAYLYGTFAADGTVKVVGDVTVEHTFTEATVAENSYALFARRGANLAKLTSTYVINDSETHYFYGLGNYGIKVESGSPTIILSDANISLNAGDQFDRAVNAIDIVAANCTTTIRVEGTENNIIAKYGAGIFVAQGSKVEITSSDQSNVLRVTGKGSSSAIGGYASSFSSNGENCGDISINKVTLYATSDFNVGSGAVSPAIGGSGNASCGTIEVSDATIYAYGVYRSDTGNTPAIGLGQTNGGQTNNTFPTIKIIDSEIYAYRGGTWADYIGKPQTSVSTSLNLGSDGSAKNSTIYCYTGTAATSVDKTVFYDANGTATEQAAE